MIVEVEGRRFELEWRDAAMLLALLWVRRRALSISHFHAIEADSGRLRARVEKLKSMGFVEEVKLGRESVIHLTDLGRQAALLLEKKAAELNILDIKR